MKTSTGLSVEQSRSSFLEHVFSFAAPSKITWDDFHTPLPTLFNGTEWEKSTVREILTMFNPETRMTISGVALITSSNILFIHLSTVPLYCLCLASLHDSVLVEFFLALLDVHWCTFSIFWSHLFPPLQFPWYRVGWLAWRARAAWKFVFH